MFYYGSEGDCNCLIIELFWNSIEDHFKNLRQEFTLRTILIIAYQMINLIKRIHSRGILHRDIKPDNFVTQNQRERYSLAIIDFGLSKSFLTSAGHHIPIIYNKSLTGTTRYASLNNHEGIEQSRRDDIESAFYIWVYLAKGKLPW